ncbi:MAG: 50S ribosomal protein L21 [Nitriliruptoraceae bacterium]
MYAVIATGGKQYRVETGQQITVEKLDGEIGDRVTLPAVMVVDGEDVTVGGGVEGRSVTATITGHDKAPRIRVFTYKNKSRQHKRRGHRQHRTNLRIDAI